MQGRIGVPPITSVLFFFFVHSVNALKREPMSGPLACCLLRRCRDHDVKIVVGMHNADSSPLVDMRSLHCVFVGLWCAQCFHVFQCLQTLQANSTLSVAYYSCIQGAFYGSSAIFKTTLLTRLACFNCCDCIYINISLLLISKYGNLLV